MRDLYFLMFALPAIASIVLLLAARRLGELTPGAALVLVPWYVIAFVLQFFGRSPAIWVTGLVLQVVLALYLSFRLRLGSI